MNRILVELWQELEKHQKAAVKIATLFIPIAYVILLLYVDGFLDTDIWNRLICSLAISGFATFVSVLLWSWYRLPADRYAPLTLFVLCLSASISVFFSAIPDMPNARLLWLSDLVKAPWSPLVVFLVLVALCFWQLYRIGRKTKKD